MACGVVLNRDHRAGFHIPERSSHRMEPGMSASLGDEESCSAVSGQLPALSAAGEVIDSVLTLGGLGGTSVHSVIQHGIQVLCADTGHF